MSIFVLVLVLTLHGNLHATKSLVAPSYKLCQDNGPLILDDYKTKGIQLGSKTLKIESGEFICLAFKGTPSDR